MCKYNSKWIFLKKLDSESMTRGRHHILCLGCMNACVCLFTHTSSRALYGNPRAGKGPIQISGRYACGSAAGWDTQFVYFILTIPCHHK